MIQSGLSSSVLAIIIVVLILLAVKEFVESMNDKQNAAIHREKIEEKVEEKVEELKEEIKEAKAERRDMLTWQNVTMGIMLVLAIVVVVLFSVGFYQGEKGKKLTSGFEYVTSAPGEVYKFSDPYIQPLYAGYKTNIGEPYVEPYIKEPFRKNIYDPYIEKLIIKPMKQRKRLEKQKREGFIDYTKKNKSNSSDFMSSYQKAKSQDEQLRISQLQNKVRSGQVIAK